MEYKTVAYAENVQDAYATPNYYNKIILVPASETPETGVNKYTEYIVVNVGTTNAPSYYAEKLGEIGVDASAITSEIEAINDKIAGENETLATTTKTLVGAINEVKATADAAIQGVGTVTSDTTHGVTLTLTENDCHNLEGSVSVTTATFTEMGATWDDENKLTTAGSVKNAIAKAISDEDGKTISASGSDAVEAAEGVEAKDAKVTVKIGGTVGAPTVTVETDDIASAEALSALDTYIKGEKVETTTGEGEDAVTTISGGIEARLADVEASIGSGTEGIGARVTTLEESVGAANDGADAEGSVYARIAATKAVADTAIQGITGDNTKAVQVVFTESTAHEVTTEVTVTTATTTGSGNNVAIDLGTDGANNDALVTAKVASDAIAAAEARATAAADDEKTARQTDVGAILDGSAYAVGTVIECAVTASETSGTFNVTVPEGVTIHVMSVEWNHEDFICKHSGNTITLWDADAVFGEDNPAPAAADIKVFALVKSTSTKATGVTA